MSIPSTRGGGHHGYLALVIPATRYNAIPTTQPVHPGAAPNHAPGSTAAQIAETNRQYKANLEEFQLFIMTETALKKCLIATVPDTFIEILKDEDFGYANVTVEPQHYIWHSHP